MKSTMFLILFGLMVSSLSCNSSTATVSVSKEMSNASLNVETISQDFQNPPFSVVAGGRIGSIELGQTAEEAKKLMSNLLRDTEYDFNVCKQTSLLWNLPISKFEGSLVEATVSDKNRIEQIRIVGDRFYHGRSIEQDMNLENFLKVYEEKELLEAFADYGLRSNSKYVYGYSGYLINRLHGIAFEFVQLRENDEWLLNSISVFPVENIFAPRFNCKQIDEGYWQRLNALTFEEISGTNRLESK